MPKMPPDRAVQFLAFDALEGFRDLIEPAPQPERGRTAGTAEEEIALFFSRLRPGDALSLLVREDSGEESVSGILAGIDLPYRTLYLREKAIPFENILKIRRVQ